MVCNIFTFILESYANGVIVSTFANGKYDRDNFRFASHDPDANDINAIVCEISKNKVFSQVFFLIKQKWQ